MKHALALACLVGALALGGCSGTVEKLKADFATVKQVFTLATTATVPADVVTPAAYAFDAVKLTATNYGRYCIQESMAPSICSADIRRAVVKAIRSGTAARNTLKYSVANGTPAAAATYNTLVDALNALNAQPITQAPKVTP